MSVLTSLRDTLLVARFELLRNLRTWRAIALCLLYLASTAGGTYIFTRALLGMEHALADVLEVPRTKKPGAMIGVMQERGDIEQMLEEMLPGDDAVVERVLGWPLLTMFHLWLAVILMPFLAATTAAECVAVDLHNRAIRFEAFRTGRLELVTGRFLGQLLLLAAASLLAVAGTWVVGMLAMTGNDPLQLLWTLLVVTPLVWALAVPFAGIGVAFSQVTSSPNVARVLALGTVVASWILLGLSYDYDDGKLGWLWDGLRLLTPQEWAWKLWYPWPQWGLGLAVLLLLGLAYAVATTPLFRRRDL